MEKKKVFNLIMVIVILIIMGTFPVLGCGGTPSSSSGGDNSTDSVTDAQTPGSSGKIERPDTSYDIPEYKEAVFSVDAAEGNEETAIDVSHISEGYFGVWSESDARLKLQVKKDELTFTYDLVYGKIDFFPLQDGDGEYFIRVMKNIEDTKYFELFSVTVDVHLNDEFTPFLYAGQYADYTEASECVKLARSMAEKAADVHDLIAQVYDYVSGNVVYDYDKADDITEKKILAYIPAPDDTLKTGKGICFDYASLAASMLRSQGVPTKIIFGYVSLEEPVYHAWNMFYTEDEGWVTVEFKTDPKKWNRMDLTFIANGSDDSFIGDGTNYADVYQY